MNQDHAPQCAECGAPIGQPHHERCDIARCLRTGGQRISCSAGYSDFHDCGQDTWTGMWPGEAECREFGWYSYWREPGPGEQYGEFVRCAADHPEASEDLNRLDDDAHWNPATRRWDQGRCQHQYVEHVVVDDEGPDRLLECAKCGNLLSEAMLVALGEPLPAVSGTDQA